MLEPQPLPSHGEEMIDPFLDDPDQAPRPPMAPASHGSSRGVRIRPVYQRRIP
jgi:hypothetical protein